VAPPHQIAEHSNALRLVPTAPLERLVFTTVDGRRILEAGDVTPQLGFASDQLLGKQTLSAPEIVARPR
jgi:hypothetical protein